MRKSPHPLHRVAAAFTSVVNSLVSDILLPPISLLPFLGRNLEEKFAVLKRGKLSFLGAEPVLNDRRARWLALQHDPTGS